MGCNLPVWVQLTSPKNRRLSKIYAKFECATFADELTLTNAAKTTDSGTDV